MGSSCFKLLVWVYFFRIHTITKLGSVTLMIPNLISLQTHLNAAYPGSINTLQSRPLCPFFYLEWRPRWWWNRPVTVIISSPILQMTGLHYLQLPWRLWSYWFSDLQFIFFFFLWMVSSHNGGQRKQPQGVCPQLTAANHVSVGWESSFREVS